MKFLHISRSHAARVLSAVALASLFSFAQAEKFKIDADHSSVNFKIGHLLSHVNGTFSKFEGSFETNPLVEKKETREIDGKKQEISILNFTEIGKAKVSIEVTSISTKNEKRDDHLRSKDFFDVANKEHPEYATMTFNTDELTSVIAAAHADAKAKHAKHAKKGKHVKAEAMAKGEKTPLQIRGTLTMHGVTKGITLALEVPQASVSIDSWNNKTVGFSASTTLDRQDFGLAFRGFAKTGELLVADKVKIEIEIAGVLVDEKKVEDKKTEEKKADKK